MNAPPQEPGTCKARAHSPARKGGGDSMHAARWLVNPWVTKLPPPPALRLGLG